MIVVRQAGVVSPVADGGAPPPPITQCRVRYLSFLGVGRDVKFTILNLKNTKKNSKNK
jgi:hypothetical protein